MRLLRELAAATLLCGIAATVLGQEDRLAALPAEDRAWLEDVVAYLITEREREVFLSLETVEERKAFIEAFWQRRDPIPATPHNEFREEHLRRLEYADRHFQDMGSRPGRRTDRGRMYVILGKPRNIESFDHYNELVTSELWFYEGDASRGLPPFFYLLFYKPRDVGEYRLYSPVLDTPTALIRGPLGVQTSRAFDQLFRISPELARASLTFDATAPVNRADTSAALLGTEMMMARIEESPKRNVRTDYLDGWLRYGKRVSADYSFNFVPSRSTFAVLLGPEGSHFLHFAVELDFENFPVETDEAGSRYYTTLDVSLEVRDASGTLVLADDKESYVELSRSQVETGSGSSFSYQDGVPLVPGTYDVSVILRNRLLQQYTVAERRVIVQAEPSLSDVVLGFQIEEDRAAHGTDELKTFELAGLRVQPATNGLFAVGDTAYAFFQVAEPAGGQAIRVALVHGDEVLEEHDVAPPASTVAPLVQPLSFAGLAGGDYAVRVRLLDAEGAGARVLAEKTAEVVLSPRTSVPRPGFTARRSFAVEEPGMLDLALGDQLWSLGRYEEATERFERAVAAGNTNLPMASWKLAGAYVRARKPDDALKLLLPLAEEHADQYEVVLGLGLSYYLKGQLPEAARHLERATEIRPASTSLLNALGDVYLRLGEPEKARRFFEKSLALDPGQESIQQQLASMPGRR